MRLFDPSKPSKKELSNALLAEKNLGYAVVRTLFGQVLSIDALSKDYACYFDEGPMEDHLQAEFAKIEQVAKAMLKAESWMGDEHVSFSLAIRYQRYREIEDLCLRLNLRMSDFMYTEHGSDLGVLYFPQENTPYLLSASIINLYDSLCGNNWISANIELGSILEANRLPYYDADNDVSSELSP